MGKSFNIDHVPTMGADFSFHVFEFDGKEIHLQIWDLAGQVKYGNLLQKYLLGCNCAFLVFDLTVRESFDDLEKWFDQLYIIPKNKNIPFVLIGNKVDLDDFKVSDAEVKQYIDDVKKKYDLGDVFVKYYFTSAKSGENIEKAFLSIAKGLVK